MHGGVYSTQSTSESYLSTIMQRYFKFHVNCVLFFGEKLREDSLADIFLFHKKQPETNLRYTHTL